MNSCLREILTIILNQYNKHQIGSYVLLAHISHEYYFQKINTIAPCISHKSTPADLPSLAAARDLVRRFIS